MIGQFSEDTSVPAARTRRVAVHRFDPPASFVTRAENVGFGRDLYRGSRHLGIDNDKYLAQFEGFALQPVEDLLNLNSAVAGIPLDTWVQIAAYVASQFARAPDLERSLDEIAALKNMPREKVDVGYLLNLPRVAAAVLRGRWDLVGTRSDLILNDRGITPAFFHDLGQQGYLIPLRRRFAARIVGGPVKQNLRWRQGTWWIDVQFVGLSGRRVEILNEMTYASAVAEVYGPSPQLLDAVAAAARSVRVTNPELRGLIQGAGLLGPSSDGRRLEEGLLSDLLLRGVQPPRTRSGRRRKL